MAYITGVEPLLGPRIVRPVTAEISGLHQGDLSAIAFSITRVVLSSAPVPRRLSVRGLSPPPSVAHLTGQNAVSNWTEQSHVNDKLKNIS